MNKRRRKIYFYNLGNPHNLGNPDPGSPGNLGNHLLSSFCPPSFLLPSFFLNSVSVFHGYPCVLRVSPKTQDHGPRKTLGYEARKIPGPRTRKRPGRWTKKYPGARTKQQKKIRVMDRRKPRITDQKKTRTPCNTSFKTYRTIGIWHITDVLSYIVQHPETIGILQNPDNL